MRRGGETSLSRRLGGVRVSRALEEAFISDLGCTPEQAFVLAECARERRSVLGAEEDTEEDLLVRLRDPVVFGAFAGTVIRDGRLPLPLRERVAEHAFDLLPLPRSEGDVFLVEGRAPRRLLDLASFLHDREAFTVLHAMHLLYAVFLDRSLLTAVDPSMRTSVLAGVVHSPGAPESMRILYAALCLASVEESEARRTLVRLLRSGSLTPEFRARLAQIVASEDGGLGSLVELSQEEGLLPEDTSAPDSPAILANIPRMPRSLAALARRWLRRHAK